MGVPATPVVPPLSAPPTLIINVDPEASGEAQLGEVAAVWSDRSPLSLGGNVTLWLWGLWLFIYPNRPPYRSASPALPSLYPGTQGNEIDTANGGMGQIGVEHSSPYWPGWSFHSGHAPLVGRLCPV